MPQSDKPLDRSLEGEFSAAVRPQVRRLYAIAYSILRDRGEADDAVQETMVKAWQRWDTIRDEKAISGWLTKICVNHCLRRRENLVTRWRHSELDERTTPARGEMPGQRMLDLDSAYRRLSPQQRAVIALTYHHGYTVDEAADLMGCRRGTAASHLGRALATLREALRDE